MASRTAAATGSSCQLYPALILCWAGLHKGYNASPATHHQQRKKLTCVYGWQRSGSGTRNWIVVMACDWLLCWGWLAA